MERDRQAGLVMLCGQCVALPLLLACVSPGFAGENGRLHYQPNADTSWIGAPGNYGIAVGGTSFYSVTGPAPSDFVGALSAVRSSNPAVIEVVSFEADRFTVRGVGVGTARVSTRAGATDDVLVLEVREIARIASSTGIGANVEWRGFLSEAFPPSDTLALIRGTDSIEVQFGLRDARGRPLFDASADLWRVIEPPADAGTVRVGLFAGGQVVNVELPVVDAPDRLVRHGSEADLVWGLRPDTDFCVAPMAGASSIVGYALRAEIESPWMVLTGEPDPQSFSTCFYVTLEEGAVPVPSEVVVTDGTLRLVLPLEP